MPSAFCCAWRPHRSTDEDVQPVTVHAALRSLGRQHEMCYLPQYATTNSLPCHFIASWRLNYTLEYIFLFTLARSVTVFTVRVSEHNFIVLTYLGVLTYIRGPCVAWTPLAVCTRNHTRNEYFITSNCVFNFNFLAPVVSEITWASQICIKGPCAPWTPPCGNFFTHPIPPNTDLYLGYIAVKFQLRSSINVRLTESSVYNRLCLKGPPKWGFGVILGVGAKIFGGKVHPSSEMRVFRHLWSRSDAPCSSILHGCSHFP